MFTEHLLCAGRYCVRWHPCLEIRVSPAFRYLPRFWSRLFACLHASPLLCLEHWAQRTASTGFPIGSPASPLLPSTVRVQSVPAEEKWSIHTSAACPPQGRHGERNGLSPLTDSHPAFWRLFLSVEGPGPCALSGLSLEELRPVGAAAITSVCVGASSLLPSPHL